MDEATLISYLGLTTRASAIPIRYRSKGNPTRSTGLDGFPVDPLAPTCRDLEGLEERLFYGFDGNGQGFASYCGTDFQIVAGPIITARKENAEIASIALAASCPSSETEAFRKAYSEIPISSLSKLLALLLSVATAVEGHPLGIEELSFPADPSYPEEKARAGNSTNNSIEIERKILAFVERGDIDGFREWAQSFPTVEAGTLAKEQLRQLKDIFICTATVVSRAAIAGGLSANESLSLSDAYIQEDEAASSADAIIKLQFRMVGDYVRRVHLLTNGKELSPLGKKVARYCREHLYEPLRTEELAKSLFMSRSYLSTTFKKENGETLVGYFQRFKCEEAKRLLRQSEASLAEISSYLAFSSPSHFARVFKKVVGVSPIEYRRKGRDQRTG